MKNQIPDSLEEIVRRFPEENAKLNKTNIILGILAIAALISLVYYDLVEKCLK